MRKIMIIILVIATLLCTGCNAMETDEQSGGTQTVVAESTITKESKAVTMKEAWEISSVAAMEWAKDAEVIKINSTDYMDTENATHGSEGSRNCWSFFYNSKSRNKQYHVYVLDGEIYSTDETTTPVYESITIEEVVIDSKDAYELATKFGITGGTEWAYGYHYLLQYYNMPGYDEPILLLVVRGISASGNEIMLDINPLTGEIVQYREKDGYDKMGKSIWKAYDENHEPISIESSEKNESNLSREEIQQEYDVFHLAKEYYVDPEELTDAIIEGIHDEKFSPFSNIKIYEKEVWEKVMTEKYGDNWKDW